MKYPRIKVKDAYIIKRKNRFYKEEHYDYFLILDEKTFKKFKDYGLPVKQTKGFEEEDVYFINVKPVWEFGEYTGIKIPAPEDEEFLERDDIDINFFVYICAYNGKEYQKLYFSKSGIEVKGEMNE